jgi:hypothetical protein
MESRYERGSSSTGSECDGYLNLHAGFPLEVQRVINLRQKTSLVEINGSFYLRIPPPLKEHLNLKVGSDTVVIEDNKKSKGVFGAFWDVDSDVEAKKKA